MVIGKAGQGILYVHAVGYSLLMGWVATANGLPAVVVEEPSARPGKDSALEKRDRVAVHPEGHRRALEGASNSPTAKRSREAVL